MAGVWLERRSIQAGVPAGPEKIFRNCRILHFRNDYQMNARIAYA